MPDRNRASIRSHARVGRAFRMLAALCVCSLGAAGVLVASVGRAAASDPAKPVDSDEVEPALRRLGDSGGLPPIGMRLDQPQQRGHWIFSYRYVRASNEGLLDGRDTVLPDTVLASGYSEVPTRQVDESHVISVAYAPLDRLTFELSLPYRRRTQDVRSATGSRTLEADGIGDARFVFVVPFIRNGDQQTHLTAGFTFPTGSIQASDSSGERLPYNVQLGSGTWDVVWGITYSGRRDRIGWGGDIHGVYRIGTNAVGYRQGTVYEASGWMSAMAHEWLSITGRMAWARRGNVHGSDPELDPAFSPSNDPYKQGWNRLEVGPGANVLLPVLGGQRIAFEWLFPIFQDLSGPQLKRDWTLTAGFQWLY